MTGKNFKFNASGISDNSFITSSDYQDMFWSLFKTGQFGLALTDERGNILMSNDTFKSDIPDPSILSQFIYYKDSEVSQSDVTALIIQRHNHKIKLNRLQLPGKPGGAFYMWSSQQTESIVIKEKSFLRNLYRAFNDNSFELTFRTSLEGNILFSNKIFVKYFGFKSHRKAREANITDLVEDQAAIKQLVSRILKQKNIYSETIRFKKNRWISTGLANCKLSKDELGNDVINWTVLDISDRYHDENSLRDKNIQLEKLNGQMERFLYSTSHDLRSPITSILGLVHLLKIESKEQVGIMEYVSRIENCAMKLDNIIKDIMSFSKSNYQRIKSTKIEAEELIWKIINSYKSDPDFSKISFEVKISGDAALYSDADRVEVIMDNLIRNAITFFDHHKNKSFVRINARLSTKEALFEIIDNGIGIAKTHTENIFNLFYKASERSKGTGLGLYIVKENIQQLKGSISLESEIGFGSVFRFTIPNDHKGKLINRKLQLVRGERA